MPAVDSWKYSVCLKLSDCKDGWVCSDTSKKADGGNVTTPMLICAPPLPPQQIIGIIPASAHTPFAGYTFIQPQPKIVQNASNHKCHQSIGTKQCAALGYTVETVDGKWLHPAKYPHENVSSVILKWGKSQDLTCFEFWGPKKNVDAFNNSAGAIHVLHGQVVSHKTCVERGFTVVRTGAYSHDGSSIAGQWDEQAFRKPVASMIVLLI